MGSVIASAAVRGTEGGERGGLEVGPVPKVHEQGAEDRDLFVGRSAVDIDRSHQRACDRLHVGGREDECAHPMILVHRHRLLHYRRPMAIPASDCRRVVAYTVSL